MGHNYIDLRSGGSEPQLYGNNPMGHNYIDLRSGGSEPAAVPGVRPRRRHQHDAAVPVEARVMRGMPRPSLHRHCRRHVPTRGCRLARMLGLLFHENTGYAPCSSEPSRPPVD